MAAAVATTNPDFPCSMQVPPPPFLHPSIDVPLPSERLATTALQAIQVDKELSPLVRRTLAVVPSSSELDAPSLLRAQYEATTNRMLRVAVNSFMESLKLVVEVMEQLDVDVLEQARKAGA